MLSRFVGNLLPWHKEDGGGCRRLDEAYSHSAHGVVSDGLGRGEAARGGAERSGEGRVGRVVVRAIGTALTMERRGTRALAASGFDIALLSVRLSVIGCVPLLVLVALAAPLHRADRRHATLWCTSATLLFRCLVHVARSIPSFARASLVCARRMPRHRKGAACRCPAPRPSCIPAIVTVLVVTTAVT